MEAIKLLDASDLNATKIQRGQRKVVLKAVIELQPDATPIHSEAAQTQDNNQPSTPENEDPYVATVLILFRMCNKRLFLQI